MFRFTKKVSKNQSFICELSMELDTRLCNLMIPKELSVHLVPLR